MDWCSVTMETQSWQSEIPGINYNQHYWTAIYSHCNPEIGLFPSYHVSLLHKNQIWYIELSKTIIAWEPLWSGAESVYTV